MRARFTFVPSEKTHPAENRPAKFRRLKNPILKRGSFNFTVVDKVVSGSLAKPQSGILGVSSPHQVGIIGQCVSMSFLASMSVVSYRGMAAYMKAA